MIKCNKEVAMVKILLICSAGMSTSLLVNKMIKAAEAKGLEDITIEAHPEAEVTSAGADADVILLGPQVRFELKKVSGLFPDKPVEVIDMQDYGMMNGQKVLEHALTLVK
jgi:PTS system cellobiose-specific IIB component